MTNCRRAPRPLFPVFVLMTLLLGMGAIGAPAVAADEPAASPIAVETPPTELTASTSTATSLPDSPTATATVVASATDAPTIVETTPPVATETPQPTAAPASPVAERPAPASAPIVDLLPPFLTVRVVDPNNALPSTVCLTLTPLDNFTDDGPICGASAQPGIRDFGFSIFIGGRYADTYHGTLSVSTGLPTTCALTVSDLAFTFPDVANPAATVTVSVGCTATGATLPSTQTSVSISSDGRLPNRICGTWIPADASTVTSSDVQCISTDWNSGTLTPNASGSSSGAAVNLKFELLPGFEACGIGGRCHSAIDANCALDSTPTISSADLNGPRTFALTIVCSGPPEGWGFQWVDTVVLGDGPYPDQICATFVATDPSETVTDVFPTCATPVVFEGQHLANIIMFITVTGERYPYRLRFKITSALPAGCTIGHGVNGVNTDYVFVLPSYPADPHQGTIVYSADSFLVCSSASPTPTTPSATETPVATEAAEEPTPDLATLIAAPRAKAVVAEVISLPSTGIGAPTDDHSLNEWFALLAVSLGALGMIALVRRRRRT